MMPPLTFPRHVPRRGAVGELRSRNRLIRHALLLCALATVPLVVIGCSPDGAGSRPTPTASTTATAMPSADNCSPDCAPSNPPAGTMVAAAPDSDKVVDVIQAFLGAREEVAEVTVAASCNGCVEVALKEDTSADDAGVLFSQMRDAVQEQAGPVLLGGVDYVHATWTLSGTEISIYPMASSTFDYLGVSYEDTVEAQFLEVISTIVGTMDRIEIIDSASFLITRADPGPGRLPEGLPTQTPEGVRIAEGSNYTEYFLRGNTEVWIYFDSGVSLDLDWLGRLVDAASESQAWDQLVVRLHAGGREISFWQPKMEEVSSDSIVSALRALDDCAPNDSVRGVGYAYVCEGDGGALTVGPDVPAGDRSTAADLLEQARN